MTLGEQIVWATEYARLQRVDNPPSDVVNDLTAWTRWELNRAVSATEGACYAVQRMRNTLALVAEGFGEESDQYKMLLKMLGKQK